jgi:hypothetical protein
VETAAAKGEHGVPTLVKSRHFPTRLACHAIHPHPSRPTAARFYGIVDLWSCRPVRDEAEPHIGSHPLSEFLLTIASCRTAPMGEHTHLHLHSSAHHAIEARRYRGFLFSSSVVVCKTVDRPRYRGPLPNNPAEKHPKPVRQAGGSPVCPIPCVILTVTSSGCTTGAAHDGCLAHITAWAQAWYCRLGHDPRTLPTAVVLVNGQSLTVARQACILVSNPEGGGSAELAMSFYQKRRESTKQDWSH